MAAASSLHSYQLPYLSNPNHQPHHYLLFRPLLPNFNNRSNSAAVINCRSSGGGGGSGFSDDILSTNSFYREFSVIANMLKQIEPLDTSVISNGVSDAVKDSMKRMISTMIGLLPSDQFSVTIRVSKRPLVRLLASSLITGYTLWNAEYRVMLMRNFENSSKRLNVSDCNGVREDQNEEIENCYDESERLKITSCLDDLSPDAVNYIQKLESELSAAKKDLHTQKQETMQIGFAKESNNDILKYLRSLDSDMLDELSRPSSSEVRRILQQLVHCTSTRVFKKEISSALTRDSVVQESYKNGDVNFRETRDYLAKLLFWCMLLGHQLRGMENRLYLRCAVGFI